jgi:hypothetical protein
VVPASGSQVQLCVVVMHAVVKGLTPWLQKNSCLHTLRFPRHVISMISHDL